MNPAQGVRCIKRQPHELQDRLTAADDLFVIAHLGIPRVDSGRWSLAIDGLVGRAGALGLDDLKAHPKKIVTAVHECWGNPLEPKVSTRRAANVHWGGVDLATLLDEFGIDARAVPLVVRTRRRLLCR
jgi:sulfane dehydrogenase subunit SoxC